MACGSFTCRKSTPRDPRLYVPSEGSHAQDLHSQKNPSTSAGFEPETLGSNGEYHNFGTTGFDSLFDPELSLDNHIQTSLEDYLKFFLDYLSDNHIQPVESLLVLVILDLCFVTNNLSGH